MALSNRIENGIIAGISVLLTVVVFGLYNHFLIYKPLQKELVAQREAIIELAKIPKYSIDNDFGKMKPKDGSDIVIDLENDMTVTGTETKPDSVIVQPEKKKGFFKRLFNIK